MAQTAANVGRIPASVHAAGDYASLAADYLPEPVLAYIAGGSGQDHTLAANRRAFQAWSVMPRVLADLRTAHTRLHLNGRECAHPILLAPVAHQQLAHANAERETVRAAAASGTPMVLSTLSNTPLEEVASVMPEGVWLQLYFQPQREHTLDLVRRAEQAGYGALMVTLDAAIQVPSRRALQAGFKMPADCRAANLVNYPQTAAARLAPGQSPIFHTAMRQTSTWADMRWLLEMARIPVWAKGVLDARDALKLRELGLAGLVVSNHGGRTLDGVPASLRMLPEIRQAVGADYPLLLDGGIRSGSDVFKALALGADAVLVGRLPLYALAVAGALGVAHMLKLLRQELEACMAVAGCATLAAVREARLVKAKWVETGPC